MLGAIAQFEATTVAKLKAARDRKIAAGEKCGGRKSYAEARPELVQLARQLRRPDPDRWPAHGLKPQYMRAREIAQAADLYLKANARELLEQAWRKCQDSAIGSSARSKRAAASFFAGGWSLSNFIS